MPIVSGVSLPDNLSEFHQQLFLFYYGNDLAEFPYHRPTMDGKWFKVKNPYEGEGRFEHFKNLVQRCFPKSFEWHDWSEKAARAFCANKNVAICGCGGSGKSTTAAMYALFWWLCAVQDSAVLIASTTIDSAKKRIWKNIRQYYTELCKKFPEGKLGETCLIGNPRPCIRSTKSDTAHGIYVVAVALGEVEKGVEALKGFHPKRLMMIGDETDSIGQAVVDVGVNQEIGTIEYQTIWLGNDPSLFNPLGKMMAPEIGKPVTIGHTEWTSTTGAKCLRFDAFDSPNIKDNDKWSGIVRKKDIDGAVAKFGQNHPQVWIMMRGIHPPEGADDTVLSEALFLRNNCQLGVTWKRSFKTIAMLDPAFGGDRCIFRTLDYGQDMQGATKVLVGAPITIQIDASDTKNPPEYQIAYKVKNMCLARGIPPQDFILDATGTGRGVKNVILVEWSPNINFCEFGGTPSTMPVSDEDTMPANEAYDRKVSELWYTFRVFVEAGMIRGLDPETAMEFCSRKFEVKNRKRAVEQKQDMKLRGAPSPDLADCLVTGIHLLRERGVNATVMSDVKEQNVADWGAKMKEHDIDGRDNLYSPAVDEMVSAGYEHNPWD